MVRRTWEYGTRLRGVVVESTQRSLTLPGKPARFVTLTIVTDEKGEGHFLLGRQMLEPVAGDRVVMEFMQGGPTGGFWLIVEKLAPQEVAIHANQTT